MNRTTAAQRQAFYRRHLRGESYAEIARNAGVSRECVRYWCRRQRDGGSCQSRYRRKDGGTLSRFAPLVRYVILRLRVEHPRWGRERIHHHLRQRASCRGLRLPHPSSIGRYLAQWPQFRRQRRKKRKRVRPAPAEATHQRWQMDFKEKIEQADGAQLMLFTVVDQYSGGFIEAQVLPKEIVVSRQEPVRWREAQAVLRCAFALWGTMPTQLQTDNEAALVGRSGIDFPSDFTLWLVGLGIDHIAIRPGKSTDNAEVERGHRTIHDYAIVGQEKLSVSALQQTVQRAARELAFDLPSRAKACAGQPPVTAYPTLLVPPRPYRVQEELALFDLNRVDAFLASFEWTRKARGSGQVQLGGARRRLSVGRKHAFRRLRIRFDPTDRHLLFAPEESPEQVLCRRPLACVTVAALLGLDDPSVALSPQQLPLFPSLLGGNFSMSRQG